CSTFIWLLVSILLVFCFSCSTFI
ncbi:hypothetical protein HPMKF10_1162, partial [Helicobacter pylori]